MRRAALTLALVGACVLLGGCGGGGDQLPGNRIAGRKLTIYVSVPLEGASAVSGEAVANGARLALAQSGSHVGRYRIALQVLDDATPTSGGWDPGQTTIDAQQAIADKRTVGYLGELDSGASAVSVPLLNRGGIPQISPTSTAVGLTSDAAGSSPGEPDKYYPTGVRTFARVIPNDLLQAAVQVHLQQSMGCEATYVLQDEEFDGQETASSFVAAAQAAGLRVVAVQTFPTAAANYLATVSSVSTSGADCVLVSGNTESGAALLTDELVAGLPHAPIFATAGLAETTFVDPADGGIALTADPRVFVSSPALPAAAFPASGRSFFGAYAREYGSPEPDAILGYEAMSLMLSAIARASDHGTGPIERSRVLAAIFATRDRKSVLGTYSITRTGDTTLRSYGVYRVQDGQLVYWKAGVT